MKANLICLSVFLKSDEQLAMLQHEKMDLLKRLEEDQEDLNELMKKHKALIAQVLLKLCIPVCLSRSISLTLPEVKLLSPSLLLV